MKCDYTRVCRLAWDFVETEAEDVADLLFSGHPVQ